MALAVTLAAIVSCTHSELVPESFEQDTATVTFSAVVEGGDTKVILDNMQSRWCGNESITVLGTNGSYLFSATAPEPVRSVDFSYSGLFEETAVLAVYPSGTYTADVSGKTVSNVTVPVTQTAVPGSFDPQAAVSIAYTEDETLAFRNVVSLLKITVGSEDVRKVTIWGRDDSGNAVDISGTGTVSYNDGNPSFSVTSGKTYVELSSKDGNSLQKGETYYIAVLSSLLEGGLLVEFDNYPVKEISRSLELKRSIIYDLGTLGHPAKSEAVTIPSGCRHGINYNSDGTVTLVLYDKDNSGWHYERCRVVGDFTGWESSEAYSMNRNDEWGCWWITLEDVVPGREYRFQYELTTGDYTVRTFDPYTEIVYDEWNDKYISSSTYSGGVPSWPSGASGYISAFCIEEDGYDWQVSGFKIEDKNDMIIYELLLRDFSTSGDLNGAIAQLDYLDDLGITAIELMPVQEFDGNLSWGYNPYAYFALDKSYGDRDTYKKFIDECHKRGIAVLLDVSYNHATGSHPFAKLYWDKDNNKTMWTNPFFNVDAPHQFSVYHDFNHSFWLVRDYVKRSLEYLLTEYKVDGFRFDLTKGFTQNSGTEGVYDQSRIDVLKEYYYHIMSVNPNAVMICEHFCDDENWELGGNGMKVWRNMNHSYCESAMGWMSNSDFTGLTNTYDGNGYTSDYLPFGTLIGYMESHDEERTMYKAQEYGTDAVKRSLKLRLKRAQLNAAFFLLVPGPKMIWQFGEIGYDYSVSYGDDRTSPKPVVTESYMADADRKALYDMYASLLKFRRDNPRFFDSDAKFRWYVDGSHQVGRYMFCEASNGDVFALFGNFGSGNQDVGLQLPRDGKWYDYFNYTSSRPNEFVWSGANHNPNMQEGDFYLLVSNPAICLKNR